jgi:hypothetical protein
MWIPIPHDRSRNYQMDLEEHIEALQVQMQKES